MPLYLFKNPVTGKVVHIHQSMNDEHIYSENGIQFERVFTSPFARLDSEVDPFSQQQFVEKTGKMKGTLGDIWDYSKEMSEKREKIVGQDNIRGKAEEKYSKKRRGMKYKEKVNPSEMPQIQVD